MRGRTSTKRARNRTLVTSEYYEGADGFFTRLTAPGDEDAEWTGPFETLEDAQDYMQDIHEIDPHTGERTGNPRRRNVAQLRERLKQL